MFLGEGRDPWSDFRTRGSGAQSTPRGKLVDCYDRDFSPGSGRRGSGAFRDGLAERWGGNYQTSIVDLLKLLDLDSSLDARKELADELGVHDADHGTAEQNIALHRAVMAKIAENGGVVPDDLRN